MQATIVITSGVVVISLGFQSPENSLTLDDLELHALDLVVEEAVERHDGGVWRGSSLWDGGGRRCDGNVVVMRLGIIASLRQL